ncbi:MAG: helix-turn-helix domain-containing protein [Nitrospirae bacterium]|nr:helix-turn-helix domain-containing protein [Nitrospirota bacterium]
MGRDKGPEWLTTDWILGQFHGRRSGAIRAYRRFVAEGLGKEVWDRLVGQIYFGDREFAGRFGGGEIREVPKPQRQPVRRELGEIVKEGTPQEVGRAYIREGYTLGEIAAQLGVHYSTVSRRLREFEKTR